jgi:pilus assembly protein CpaE
MGNDLLLTGHLEKASLRDHSRFLVVASAHHAQALKQAPPEILPGLRVAELGAGDAIADDLLTDVALVVVEVDPQDSSSMQRIGQIRTRWSDLPIVAAIEGASVSLVRTLLRQGVSDVVALPFDQEELLQVTLDAVANRKTSAREAAALAPMVAVVRSLGGCGATSIATHLAADLAAHDNSGRGSVIADLDLQFGSVADYLGLRPRASLADLLGAETRLDEDLLRSVAAEAGGGLSVIAAPDAIMPLESVETDDLLRVIRLLRQQFGYVVLDLPANWTNWTLSAASAANTIVLVVELSVASLRQAQRRLELFRSVGIDERSIEIVVNRVESRLFRTIGIDDVAKTLRHPVTSTVAFEATALNAAQNQGALLAKSARKSKFADDIARLGETLRAGRLSKVS